MTTLRPYFAWALLAYVGAELFFAFLNWVIIGDGTTVVQRSYRVDVTTLTTVGFPILAVLIHRNTLVARIALIEYLVILGFGALVFLLGMLHVFDFVHNVQTQVAALSYLVFALLGFLLAGLCAVAAWRLQSPLGAARTTHVV